MPPSEGAPPDRGNGSDVVEFAPETRPHWLLVGALALAAGALFWMAADVPLLTRGREPGVFAATALVGAVCGALAYLSWRSTLWWQGWLRVSARGVAFEQWKRNRIPPQDVPWSDVAAILRRSGPRQPTLYGVELHPWAGQKRGRVYRINGSGLDYGRNDPLKALRAGAKAAGYSSAPDGGIRQLGFETRWSLRPTDPTE